MVFNSLFKKPTSILTDEDKIELKEIQRKSYMEEARKIMQKRGEEMARSELSIKQKKESF